MAQLSKLYIQNALKDYDCHAVIHPWNKNCFYSSIDMAFSTLKGCGGFFVIMHLLQYLFRLKNKRKINKWQAFRNFLKSLTVGVSYASSFVFLNCFFRKIFGRIEYNILLYVVPLCNGLPIFLETPERRDISATTFLSMVLEGFYRSLINRKVILRSKSFETILFMVINGFLMYHLAVRQELNCRNDNNVWFFNPSRLKGHDNFNSNYFFEYSYVKDIMKETAKYGCLGFIMSLIRFSIFKLMSPIKRPESFFQIKNFQLPCFSSSYVFIFKAINYYLWKVEGNNYKHTFIAGLLSGVSFWFSPNLTLLFTALAVLLKISGKQIRDDYKLPKLPYLELSFIISNMFLLQMSVLDFESVPKFFQNMLAFCTRQKGNIVLEVLRRALQI